MIWGYHYFWKHSYLTITFGPENLETCDDDVIEGQRSPGWWCKRSDDPWHMTSGLVGGFQWKKLAKRGDAVYFSCRFKRRGGDAILQLNNNDKLGIYDLLGFKNYIMYKYLYVLQDFMCPTLVSDLLFSWSFSVNHSASHSKTRLDRNVTHRRSLSKRIW